MRTYLAGLLAVFGSLCLVAGFDLWVARALVTPAAVEDFGEEVLASPGARSAIGRELVARVQHDPERFAALVKAFGEDWEDDSLQIALLAVQTAEFESEFRATVAQGNEVAFEGGSSITVDGLAAIGAIETELDADIVEVLPLLPPSFFIVTDEIDNVNVRRATAARDAAYAPMVVCLLVGGAAIAGAGWITRSVTPLAIASGLATIVAVMQWVAVSVIRADVLVAEESVLNELVLDYVTGRIIRWTLLLVVLAFLPLAALAFAAVLGEAMGRRELAAAETTVPSGEIGHIRADDLPGLDRLV